MKVQMVLTYTDFPDSEITYCCYDDSINGLETEAKHITTVKVVNKKKEAEETAILAGIIKGIKDADDATNIPATD